MNGTYVSFKAKTQRNTKKRIEATAIAFKSGLGKIPEMNRKEDKYSSVLQ